MDANKTRLEAARERMADIEKACRPAPVPAGNTLPLRLFYVHNTTAAAILLRKVGEPSLAVDIAHSLPGDVLPSLMGRHCWVRGGWGDVAKIERWVDLPKELVQ